jgi:hypothetical protein
LGDEAESEQQSQPSEITTSTESGRTFTQDEFTAQMAKEKDQGRRSGAREAIQKIADELGMPVEEAKKVLEANRQRTEQEKTEVQRATEQAEVARKEAENARAEAALVTHKSRVKDKLLDAGVPRERLAYAAKAIDTGVDGSDEDLDAEI